MDEKFLAMETKRRVGIIKNIGWGVVRRERNIAFKTKVSLFCRNASILAIPIGSGQTWTNSVLNCYLNYLYNEDFDGVYMSGFDTGKVVGVKFAPPANWNGFGAAVDLRRLNGESGVSFVFGGHPKYSSVPFLNLKAMRRVFVTRGLLNAIYAKTKKYYSQRYHNESYIQDSGEYDLDRFRSVMRENVAGNYFRFYNEWGLYLRNGGSSNSYFFRFEDLKADPVDGFREILSLLLYDEMIDESFLLKSVEQADLDTVKRNYSSLHGRKKTFYVGNQGAVSYEYEMSDSIKNMILEEIDQAVLYPEVYPYSLY